MSWFGKFSIFFYSIPLLFAYGWNRKNSNPFWRIRTQYDANVLGLTDVRPTGAGASSSGISAPTTDAVVRPATCTVAISDAVACASTNDGFIGFTTVLIAAAASTVSVRTATIGIHHATASEQHELDGEHRLIWSVQKRNIAGALGDCQTQAAVVWQAENKNRKAEGSRGNQSGQKLADCSDMTAYFQFLAQFFFTTNNRLCYIKSTSFKTNHTTLGENLNGFS